MDSYEVPDLIRFLFFKSSFEVVICLFALFLMVLILRKHGHNPIIRLQALFYGLAFIHFGVLALLDFFNIHIHLLAFFILHLYGLLFFTKHLLANSISIQKLKSSLLLPVLLCTGSLVFNYRIPYWDIIVHLLVAGLSSWGLWTIVQRQKTEYLMRWLYLNACLFIGLNIWFIVVITQYENQEAYLVVKLVFVALFLAMMVVDYFFLSSPKLKAQLNAQQQEASIDITIEQVDKFLVKNQAFLNPGLKLDGLAKMLNIDARQLSQLINYKKQLHFRDFVNTYRIEYSKELLSHPEYDNLTMAGVGQESGFKSKDAFYRAFKKNTGMTPAQFKKSRSH